MLFYLKNRRNVGANQIFGQMAQLTGVGNDQVGIDQTGYLPIIPDGIWMYIFILHKSLLYFHDIQIYIFTYIILFTFFYIHYLTFEYHYYQLIMHC